VDKKGGVAGKILAAKINELSVFKGQALKNFFLPLPKAEISATTFQLCGLNETGYKF
jgi:hypothetical protein